MRCNKFFILKLEMFTVSFIKGVSKLVATSVGTEERKGLQALATIRSKGKKLLLKKCLLFYAAVECSSQGLS